VSAPRRPVPIVAALTALGVLPDLRAPQLTLPDCGKPVRLAGDNLGDWTERPCKRTQGHQGSEDGSECRAWWPAPVRSIEEQRLLRERVRTSDVGADEVLAVEPERPAVRA
jgi:hypothetical protein